MFQIHVVVHRYKCAKRHVNSVHCVYKCSKLMIIQVARMLVNFMSIRNHTGYQ